MYANGENEKLISKVLVPNRDKIFIATKFGFRFRDGKARHSGNLETIDAILRKYPNTGERYSKGSMKLVNN